jgi:Tol biopolymer transport system component
VFGCLAASVLLSGCGDLLLLLFILGGRAPEFPGEVTASLVVGADSAASASVAAVQTDGDSFDPALSSDGQILAVASLATNLDSRCADGVLLHVFVVIVRTGQTTCVSLAPDGSPANQDGFGPRISANGRFVAFTSFASNLVPGDTNGLADVFVHDRQTGLTTRVSVASDDTQGDFSSFFPSLSADGRFVAFESDATNLVPGDTNGDRDLFVHDRQTGQTTRVSVASDGTPSDRESRDAAISADGRFVAFTSFATNLVAGDTNGVSDVFVHDRQTGDTTRVSVASDGTEATGGMGIRSLSPALSGDGRVVVFVSNAANLVPGDTNADFDVFAHDRGTGATALVGRRGTRRLGERAPALSADGTLVAFDGPPTALGGQCPGTSSQIHAHDRVTGVTLCATPGPAPDFPGGNNESFAPALSGNGRVLAFATLATNLIPGDTNDEVDVLLVGVQFPLGVFVATGDVDGDGRAEIIASTGAGVGPLVRVFRGNGGDTGTRFVPYAEAFTGGVRVASCDLDGDGRADVITGPGAGGGPHVKVFSGAALPGLVELASFFAYDPAFAGGVRVAAGDVNGDGRADVITAAGRGGGPHVRVFSGAALPGLGELASFFAYDPAFTGGLFVAAGDLNGDGRADIITGADAGGGPHVRVFSGQNLAVELAGFFAYASAFVGGAPVAAGNLDGTGPLEIVTAAGPGGGPHVRGFSGSGVPLGVEFLAF